MVLRAPTHASLDENRDRVLASNGLTTLQNQLSDDGVLPFTISVLYNVLVDHEPAQLAASNAGLSAHLVNLISGPRVAHCQNVLGMVGMILEILVAHRESCQLHTSSTPLTPDRNRGQQCTSQYTWAAAQSYSKPSHYRQPVRLTVAHIRRSRLSRLPEPPGRLRQWRKYAHPPRILLQPHISHRTTCF
jgi:hypothetical protein